LNNYSILIPYLKVWVFWYNSGFSLILLGGYILCCADYVFASRMYINVSCLIIVYGFWLSLFLFKFGFLFYVISGLCSYNDQSGGDSIGNVEGEQKPV
jgi:hypothetical protein